MQYYLMLEGVIYGPYRLSEMQSFRLFADTPVHLSLWPDDKWVHAADLPELRDSISDLLDISNSTSAVMVQQPNSTNPDSGDQAEKSSSSIAWIIPVMTVIAVIVVLGFMQCDREEKENKYTNHLLSYQRSNEQTVKSSRENEKINAINKKYFNRNYTDGVSNNNHSRDLKKIAQHSEIQKTQYVNSYSSRNTYSLVGTKWYWEDPSLNKPGMMLRYYRKEWEFKNDGTVEISIFYGYGGKEVNHMYKYCYETNLQSWRMWNWNEEARLNYSGKDENALKEQAYKNGLYYNLKFNNDKLTATDFSGYEQHILNRMK